MWRVPLFLSHSTKEGGRDALTLSRSPSTRLMPAQLRRIQRETERKREREKEREIERETERKRERESDR